MRTYEKSLELYEINKLSLVGGVGGNARSPDFGYKPHPLFMTHGEGSRVFDVDGNEYIDYLCAYGPLILGHRPASVINAVKETLDEMGPMLGKSHSIELEAAQKVVKSIPSYELVRFGNTGSEAVQAALRVARAYTGKEKILRFEGHYHGLAEVINFSSKPPLEKAGSYESPNLVSGSWGVPSIFGELLIVRPWNDSPVLEESVKKYQNEIAAIITEPIMCNCGVITPESGYLEFLRDITLQNDIVLIFDEVKTGYRVAYGGAQEIYEIFPDLTVTAKALGAGFPIAAIGGKKDLMETIALSKVAQSATYHTNPVSMAACKAALEEMEKPGFFENLSEKGDRLQKGLRQMTDDLKIEAVIQGVGPVFQIHFSDRNTLKNYREMAMYTRPDDYAVFWRAMLDRGILFNAHQQECWFVSAAHSEEDIKITLEKAYESLEVVKKKHKG
jgi:glutamate-1-semialdehyde 2,1-aminomutase